MKRYSLVGFIVAIVLLVTLAGVGGAGAQTVNPNGSDWMQPD